MQARIKKLIILLLFIGTLAIGAGDYGDGGDFDIPEDFLLLGDEEEIVFYNWDTAFAYGSIDFNTVSIRASGQLEESYRGRMPINSGDPNSVLFTPGDIDSQWVWAVIESTLIDINSSDPNIISIGLPTKTPWNVMFADVNGYPLTDDPNDFTYYQPERAFGIGMDSIVGRTYADNLIEVYSLLLFDPNTLSTSIGWGGDHSMTGPNNVRIGFGAGTALDTGIENTLGGKDAGLLLVDANDNSGWGYKVIGGLATISAAEYPTLRTTDAQADPGLTHTTPISSLTDLENMANDLAGNYYLTGNIDASGTADPGYNSGAGWLPIGTSITAPFSFTGTFDGAGYTISNLYIDRNSNAQALFAWVGAGATIANVTLSNVNITGGTNWCAALAAYSRSAATGDILFQNCHSSGTITSSGSTMGSYGGLLGLLQRNAVDETGTVYVYDCSSSCTLDMANAVNGAARGGLISDGTRIVVRNSFATGSLVNGTDTLSSSGGLIGNVILSDLFFCYATGDIEGGNDRIGGLFGSALQFVNCNSCYATGNVEGQGLVGGLGGNISSDLATPCTMTDCYAWGNVTGDDSVGGFIGIADDSGTIHTNCYSIGTVTGNTNVGGFGGQLHVSSTQTSCYWDVETSGQANSSGDEVGKTTTQMKTKTTYTNWDFDTIWTMPGGPNVHRVTAFGAYAAARAVEGADDGLYLGTYSGAYNETDPNRFFLDVLDRGDYPGNQQHGMMYGYFDVDPNNQWLHINAYLRALRYEVDNSATYIDSDGSGNMTFTDAVVGTKTLQELGSPTYKIIDAITQSEGDLHLSDGSTWAISKALIKTIRVFTSSTDWDLWILQNDNGFAADDANVPMFRRVNSVSGNATLMMNVAYEDEDASGEVHLYYIDNSGANTADIYIIGYQMI